MNPTGSQKTVPRSTQHLQTLPPNIPAPITFCLFSLVMISPWGWILCFTDTPSTSRHRGLAHSMYHKNTSSSCLHHLQLANCKWAIVFFLKRKSAPAASEINPPPSFSIVTSQGEQWESRVMLFGLFQAKLVFRRRMHLHKLQINSLNTNHRTV